MKNFYVSMYNSNGSLKSWNMRLITRERCCCKISSTLKNKIHKLSQTRKPVYVPVC